MPVRLNGPWYERSRRGDVGVEPLRLGELDELVEHLEVVLAVGVDGEDQIVGVELAAPQPFAQLGQGGEVRLRHAPVHLVHEEMAVRPAAGQEPFDLGPGSVGGTVVDHHELVDVRVELLEHDRDHRLFVVRGNHGDPARRRRDGTHRGFAHEAACCSRYQARVLRRPSANVCSGTQPSSSRARSLCTMRAR